MAETHDYGQVSLDSCAINEISRVDDAHVAVNILASKAFESIVSWGDN